jgi:hypothetical protein
MHPLVRRRIAHLPLIAALIAVLLVPAAPAEASNGGTPVRGAPVLTEQQLLRWFESINRPTYRASVPPAELISLYYQEGAREGVAADRAFVQAIHETGWFSYGGSMVPASANNFAGMGAFDGSGGEWVFQFPDARTGVRAQMHHLRIYADPSVNTTGSNLGSGSIAQDIEDRYPPYWRRIRNGSNNAGVPYHGIAQTWEQFGNGNWATDPLYSEKLITGYYDSSGVWREALYARALLFNGYPRDAASQSRWLQRNRVSGGAHDFTAYFGSKAAGDVFLGCDWNGDGRATPGVFRDGTWMYSNQRNGGGTITTFQFGQAGDRPLCADWNGNGQDGIAVVRDGRWHLRQTPTSGATQVTFAYGGGADIPLAGDWNGNGRAGVGIVRDGRWHLRHTPSGGSGQIVFTYGRVMQGDIPLVGDWTGNGQVGVAIVRNGRWHLRRTPSGGSGEIVFTYGRVLNGDIPVVGDWNRNGQETPAIIR